jgi:hypothetical protein
MEVTAWKGGTYGIRVGKNNVRQYFVSGTKSVDVEIDGHVYAFPLSSTFWTTCPEFRGKPVGAWLRKNNLIPWPKRQPPKLKLLLLGNNTFRLTLNREQNY